MQSKATTVEQYLKEIPEDRKEAIQAVRQTILENLPDGYVEVMNWGMITYEIPLETYPDTYNKKPLMYAALASQKNHMAVYLCSVYSLPGTRYAFEKKYEERIGKKPNMGASCLRFTKLEQVPLDLIGEVIAGSTVDEFIDFFNTCRKK